MSFTGSFHNMSNLLLEISNDETYRERQQQLMSEMYDDHISGLASSFVPLRKRNVRYSSSTIGLQKL